MVVPRLAHSDVISSVCGEPAINLLSSPSQVRRGGFVALVESRDRLFAGIGGHVQGSVLCDGWIDRHFGPQASGNRRQFEYRGQAPPPWRCTAGLVPIELKAADSRQALSATTPL